MKRGVRGEKEKWGICDEEASPSLIFGDAYEERKGASEIAVRATSEKS